MGVLPGNFETGRHAQGFRNTGGAGPANIFLGNYINGSSCIGKFFRPLGDGVTSIFINASRSISMRLVEGRKEKRKWKRPD